MKHTVKRSFFLLLALVLCLNLLSGLSLTADAVSYIANWGSRGTVATYLSQNAENFYAENDVSYEELSALSGGTATTAYSSELYAALKQLMVSNHDYITGYDATKSLYCYTDCQNGDYTSKGAISSFYSGLGVGPDWDGGSTWNREHVWPNSKGLEGSDEDDIMMLRPTSIKENSSRGNTAYGESSGYYDPNSVSGGQYNLHGDVARIVLYVYVRWGNTQYLWGSSGVMESLDVLLKWMEEDPVDTWELGRNDSVESITGTRNVFVDYPELAFLLFNQPVPGNMTTPSGEGAALDFTLTATVNDPSFGSVAVSGRNINAVPAEGYQVAGYTVISGEAAVKRIGNVFVVYASSDCTICINFEPRTALGVYYSQNGEVVSAVDALSGDEITLPSHTGDAPEGYTFRGWITSYLEETTEVPANILQPGQRYTVNETITFYALYSRLDDSGAGNSGLYELYSGTLTEGDYLIVFDGAAMKSEETSKPRLFFSTVEIANDAITQPADDLVWHIAPIGDGFWSIYNASEGVYAASTASNNTAALENSLTENGKWTPYAGYEFVNKTNSRYLRKNGTYGFACYSTDTGGPLSLYKASSGTVYYSTEVKPVAPPCDHSYGQWIAEVPATCTAEGTKGHYHCVNCSQYFDEDYVLIEDISIGVKAHSYGQWVEEIPATCTEPGVKGYYHCGDCGLYYDENDMQLKDLIIAAAGHDYGQWVVEISATCTENGVKGHYHCTGCGLYFDEEFAQLKDLTIASTGHSYGQWIEEIPATCTVDGIKAHYECTGCGLYFDEKYAQLENLTIAAPGHSWEDESATVKTCAICGSKSGYQIVLPLEEAGETDSVWIDGKEYPVTRSANGYVLYLQQETATNLVVYTYNDPDATDVHTQYPIGMKVWMLDYQDGGYTAEYIPEFDNLLQYSGSSIRIVGKKGIRMITSVNKNTKAALTGKGIEGYTLLEYGTLLGWASELDEENALVLGKSYSKSNYAYKKGVADPVFATTGDLVQYTNVLVGFSNDQCKDDIAMRPYIILQNEDGEQITVYGGVIYRSIGYIAYQNRTVFKSGTNAYNFVWEIIHHVYGDQFDADYKG